MTSHVPSSNCPTYDSCHSDTRHLHLENTEPTHAWTSGTDVGEGARWQANPAETFKLEPRERTTGNDVGVEVSEKLGHQAEGGTLLEVSPRATRSG